MYFFLTSKKYQSGVDDQRVMTVWRSELNDALLNKYEYICMNKIITKSCKSIVIL